jgi:hypothetical protein
MSNLPPPPPRPFSTPTPATDLDLFTEAPHPGYDPYGQALYYLTPGPNWPGVQALPAFYPLPPLPVAYTNPFQRYRGQLDSIESGVHGHIRGLSCLEPQLMARPLPAAYPPDPHPPWGNGGLSSLQITRWFDRSSALFWPGDLLPRTDAQSLIPFSYAALSYLRRGDAHPTLLPLLLAALSVPSAFSGASPSSDDPPPPFYPGEAFMPQPWLALPATAFSSLPRDPSSITENIAEDWLDSQSIQGGMWDSRIIVILVPDTVDTSAHTGTAIPPTPGRGGGCALPATAPGRWALVAVLIPPLSPRFRGDTLPYAAAEIRVYSQDHMLTYTSRPLTPCSLIAAQLAQLLVVQTIPTDPPPQISHHSFPTRCSSQIHPHHTGAASIMTALALSAGVKPLDPNPSFSLRDLPVTILHLERLLLGYCRPPDPPYPTWEAPTEPPPPAYP